MVWIPSDTCCALTCGCVPALVGTTDLWLQLTCGVAPTQVLVIPDTMKDARFANNLKCTVNPKIRFYCGAPLVASNGHRLGTL